MKSTRIGIGIILADPDRQPGPVDWIRTYQYTVQPNLKAKLHFFQKFQYTLQNIEH